MHMILSVRVLCIYKNKISPGDIYGSILFGLGILYLLMNFIVINYINF